MGKLRLQVHRLSTKAPIHDLTSTATNFLRRFSLSSGASRHSHLHGFLFPPDGLRRRSLCFSALIPLSDWFLALVSRHMLLRFANPLEPNLASLLLFCPRYLV